MQRSNSLSVLLKVVIEPFSASQSPIEKDLRKTVCELLCDRGAFAKSRRDLHRGVFAVCDATDELLTRKLAGDRQALLVPRYTNLGCIINFCDFELYSAQDTALRRYT